MWFQQNDQIKITNCLIDETDMTLDRSIVSMMFDVLPFAIKNQVD